MTTHIPPLSLSLTPTNISTVKTQKSSAAFKLDNYNNIYHTLTHTHIYIYIYFFFNFHHIMCESTCDTLASSAANQGDNTVLVAQGGTATRAC